MITTFALFSLPQCAADRAGLIYFFLRDGLMGALVVSTAVGLCGIL